MLIGCTKVPFLHHLVERCGHWCCTDLLSSFSAASLPYMIICWSVFLPDSCLRGCIMRFITFRSPVKPCLVKYFKWLLKVIKEHRAGKGTFRPATMGRLEAQRPLFPPGDPSSRGLGRTLILMGHHVLYLVHAHTDHAHVWSHSLLTWVN